MGAANFQVINARNVYAVLMNYECPKLDEYGDETEELEIVCPDRSECDDFISELKYSILEKIKDTDIQHHERTKNIDSNRNYEATFLFMLYKRKTFADVDVDVEINCMLRSAYYEGASLDWSITCTVGDNDIDDFDFEDSFEVSSELNAGMQKIQVRNSQRWAVKTSEELINFVEEFYKENSTPLKVAAQFSNGETSYLKI